VRQSLNIKPLFVSALVASALFVPAPAHAQPAPSERIVNSYIAPADQSHLQLMSLLKANRALERIRDVLLPIQCPVRWPSR
jgi:hypothetical protein